LKEAATELGQVKEVERGLPLGLGDSACGDYAYGWYLEG